MSLKKYLMFILIFVFIISLVYAGEVYHTADQIFIGKTTGHGKFKGAISSQFEFPGSIAVQSYLYIYSTHLHGGGYARFYFDGHGGLNSLGTSQSVFSIGTGHRLRILENGNIGIGRTPSYRLDVNGVTKARGGFMVERRSSDISSTQYGRFWVMN